MGASFTSFRKPTQKQTGPRPGGLLDVNAKIITFQKKIASHLAKQRNTMRLAYCWTAFALLNLQISAFPQMAGSCNGVFGKHLPNSVSGDGGYRIGISVGSILADGTQSANVSIYHTGFTLNTSTTPSQPANGNGYYYGFLIRSFDPNTGSLQGTFQTSLPDNTMLYQGCSFPSSAVSHNMPNTAYVTTNPTLDFQFSWPANTDIAFQAFVVETTNVFYQVEHTVVHQVRRFPPAARLTIPSTPTHPAGPRLLTRRRPAERTFRATLPKSTPAPTAGPAGPSRLSSSASPPSPSWSAPMSTDRARAGAARRYSAADRHPGRRITPSGPLGPCLPLCLWAECRRARLRT